MYDWANSAFATTVMAGFFPVFFKSYWASGMSATESTVRLGTTNAVASLLVVLLAPVLGVVADRSGSKKRLLLLLAMLGALMSGGLFLVAEGQWGLAAALYVFGVIGFAGGNVTYDALLIDVAARDEFERISALGYAMGYLGGGLLFAVNVLMVSNPDGFGFEDKAAAVRAAFLMVAVWWALFSIPVALFVKESAPHADAAGPRGLRVAWQEFRTTWRLLRTLRMAFVFLVAYWCYIDGVDTIVRMAVDYGLSLGFAAETLLTALLLTQVVGFPAALVFGRVGDRIGAKRALWLALAVYVLVVFWAARMSQSWEFYGLAVAIGLVQGGVQAMSRAMFARLIPAEHAGRLFGLYNMMGKFAAVIGPLLVGWVAVLSGSSRLGIFSVLILFVAGAWLLAYVDEARGQREAAGILDE
ncbi:MAG: MFS transporter [Gammaproteobacteria bacterium]|nr:MFS transporter [Gammaproteobacteria bacterium]MCB1922901.1 MFS transporter [Gammaproteobacteria bacterium]